MQYAILLQVALAFFASVSNANYAYHTATWPNISPPAPARYNARNATLAPRGELAQRAITDKAVFIHHMVGLTYSYKLADWEDDWRQIRAKGIDAVALNIGGADWQRNQVSLAYQAAQNVNNGLKLFYSFDFTEMACDSNDIIGRVTQFTGSAAQFKVDGKPLIGSFSGKCAEAGGLAFWQRVKSGTNGYLMPFLWELEGEFPNWYGTLDQWQCFGCAWPQGNYAKNLDDDNWYMGLLGGRIIYSAVVSPWFYTHYSWKNRYMRGDDWLYVTRWEQIMSIRDRVQFAEIATWNDYGESHYVGPIKGTPPAGTNWINGFPHTAWHDLSAYFIKAFKTGSYPTVTLDEIYFWARTHPENTNPTGDSIGRPDGWDWGEDSLWAVAFAKASAQVTLTCGSSTQTFNVNAGYTKLKLPLSPGKITVKLRRNNADLINYTPSDYNYVTNPVIYNLNAWVGHASANNKDPEITTTTATTTSTTSTAPSATVTAGGKAWAFVGCYQDSDERILVTGPYSDSALTVSKCLSNCNSRGMTFAGVQYGTECWCANSIRAGASKRPDSECSKSCAGNGSEKCGEAWRIGVYNAIGPVPTTTTAITTTTSTSTSTSTTSATTSPSTPTSWTRHGCISEGATGSKRALTGAYFSRSDMTPGLCQNLCAGFKYAGVEYGKECYCGNTATDNGATGSVVSESSCQTTCAGDSTKKCGGANTLDLYMRDPVAIWESRGCYQDSGSSRALQGASLSQAAMTIDKCQSFCRLGGYTLAGLEYGRECYCSSQLTKSGSAGLPVAASQCNVACGGNSAQTCGGAYRMNMYSLSGTNLVLREEPQSLYDRAVSLIHGLF